MALRKLWSGWKKPLLLVTPETVVRWHRLGFRLYWSWLSRTGRAAGRKPSSREVRDLIFRIVVENPTWGAPRIHGELLKLVWCPRNKWTIYCFFFLGARQGTAGLNLLQRSPTAIQFFHDRFHGGHLDQGFGLFIPSGEKLRDSRLQILAAERTPTNTLATTLRTRVPPNSANWCWWAQNATGNGYASSARRAPRAGYGCHRCPSPDAKGEAAGEILRLSDAGTSGIPDVNGVDNTLSRLCLAPVPERQTAW